MSQTSFPDITPEIQDIRQQFQLESDDMQRNNPVIFYRNRQYAFEDINTDLTRVASFVVSPKDHIGVEFFDRVNYPFPINAGNGTIIQCPPRTMLVLFNNYTPFVYHENFTLVTDWTRPNIKMDGICEQGTDGACLRHNLRYGMVDLEQLAIDEDASFSHLTLKDRLSHMNVWHPRWNLYQIIEYMLRAYGSFGSADPCTRMSGQKSRYLFHSYYRPDNWSECDTLKLMIRRYIFFSVDFIYNQVINNQEQFARDFLAPYISNREFDMMYIYWGIPGAHRGNNDWKLSIDNTTCPDLIRDWNNDDTYQWSTYKKNSPPGRGYSLSYKDMDFFDCHIKGHECTKNPRNSELDGTYTYGPAFDYCSDCSGCGKNLFGYRSNYDYKYRNYSLRCDNNVWSNAQTIPEERRVTDGIKTCPFDPYGITIPDGVNDKNHLCWKHSYLVSSDGQTKCSDTPHFFKNYCKGSPVDDLKIHSPDQDFPNARWLSDNTCKSMLTKEDLDELCIWAADNNHTNAISGYPIHEYCGCSANVLESIPTRAEYFWKMGPNELHAEMFLRMARTTGITGNAYASLFGSAEIQQNIGSESDDNAAKTAMVSHIPSACWSSCSQFKNAKRGSDFNHLIDDASSAYCMTSGCQNDISIGDIDSGVIDMDNINMGCNYITQYGNGNPDLTGDPNYNNNNNNNDNDDNVTKKEIYTLFGIMLFVFLIITILLL